MTKADLISQIANSESVDSTKQDISAIIDSLVEVIKESILVGGDSITIPGLGTFKQKSVPARVGRNPKTGDSVNIPAKIKLVFKMSSSLK